MRIKARYDSRGQRLIDKLFKLVEKSNMEPLTNEEKTNLKSKIERIINKIKDRKK